MEPETNKKPLFTSYLKLLLKLGVSIACLWYVFSSIDTGKIGITLQKTNWGWLVASLVIYSFSKLAGALRLSFYFKAIGMNLTGSQNTGLYWLGMFYNLFLPGAITGDAYKVIALSRKTGIPYKKIASAVLLDRFSGLLSLGMIVAIYSFFAVNERIISIGLVLGAIASLPLLYLFTRRFFPAFLPVYWPTLLIGLAVQLAVLLSVYFILFALHLHDDMAIYIFIFLVAAIASVLPVSFGGGLGLRELVIIEGAAYTGLGTQGEQNAFMLSMLFYIVTVICSAGGIPFIFKDPLSNMKAN